MSPLILPVVVEADAGGYFLFTAPHYRSATCQGDGYEEAVENIKDAIKVNIADRAADGEEIADHVIVSLSTVEVSV
jgi:predicted RNase H-like HicB family nuclease